MPHSLMILLAAEPDKTAKFAELVAPILSGLAFTLSAAAFIFTVLFQLKERRRNIRQTLSTALSEVAGINAQITTLRQDKHISPDTLQIIRNYDYQRATLLSSADFLIREHTDLATDADCELMAMTYDGICDIAKATEYWEKALILTTHPARKHLHQRDYAAFLFNINEIDKARELFRVTSGIRLTCIDDNLRNLAGTYLVWARLERDMGNGAIDSNELISRAQAKCDQIRNKAKKAELQQLIGQMGS